MKNETTYIDYEVIIYGGTAAALSAAIQAQRMKTRVAIVSPDTHLGGMVTSGLGFTDSKFGDVIGGIAREFHHRVWKHYRRPESWTKIGRSDYAASAKAQPGPAIDDAKEVMWTFEPHVAEKILEEWLAEEGIPIFRNEWLDRGGGVTLQNHRIESIRMISGRVFRATMFIDATYEGDLMAAAGVTYRIGRDRADEYDEPLNGIYFNPTSSTLFEGVNPYRKPDDPKSGLIAGLDREVPSHEKEGDADTRLQAFNFRLCLTQTSENRIPITKPEDYDDARYELLFRVYEAGRFPGFTYQAMPNGKTDSNNDGAFSLDYVGGNYSLSEGWNYSECSYAEREQIKRDHLDYIQGLLWSLMNHPRISGEHRARWGRFGLARDEFTDNANWPRQIYVREARRLTGSHVMTQHHVQRVPGYEVNDSIGLGSYALDSHRMRRIVIDGKIWAEGAYYVPIKEPYPVSYGAILPRKHELENLLVPVTLSATHAAFGSIRMEPTYMILGQSAGTAAAFALRQGIAVQDVSYSDLSKRLRLDGQILDCLPVEKSSKELART